MAHGAAIPIVTSPRTAGVLCLSVLFAFPSGAQSVYRDPDLNNDGIVNGLDVSRASACLQHDVRLSQPSVTITSLVDGSRLATHIVEVRGGVANTATLTINGASTAFSSGAYAATIALSWGANIIEVVATIADTPACWDADFNDDGKVDEDDVLVVNRAYGWSGFPKTELPAPQRMAVAQITVILDDTPLVVAITAPAHGGLTFAGLIDVAGTVGDPTAAVTLNGAPASTSNGVWKIAGVALAPGLNTLTALAKDPAGNTASESINVTRLVETNLPLASPPDPPSL